MQPFDTLAFILRHPISGRHPVSAIYRYVHWQIVSRLYDEMVVDWVDGAKLVAKNGMKGATGNIYCGLHEFRDMAFLIHLLKSGDLFLDIGANVGSYTVLASRVCGAKTIAFEPDPGAAAALQKNVTLNNIEDLVLIRQSALGSRDGQLKFTVGLDTVNRVALADACKVQTVPVHRLNSIPEAVGAVFAKMDIEGYEKEALLGATALLSSESVLAVQSESSETDVCRIFDDFGFQRMTYDPFTRQLSASDVDDSAANTLFVRDQNAVSARLSAAPIRDICGYEI